MAKKKATRKDLELELYQLHLRCNQLNHYMSGIAEMLNKYIKFGGKSKKFYDSLQKEIDKGEKDGAIRKE